MVISIVSKYIIAKPYANVYIQLGKIIETHDRYIVIKIIKCYSDNDGYTPFDIGEIYRMRLSDFDSNYEQPSNEAELLALIL